MIVARNVGVRARGAALLDGVGLALEPGTVTAVVGPLGAGKSTLVAVLAGERRPDSGSVTLDDRPLAAWPGRALARRRAVLAPAAALDLGFTVGEVVALGRVPWPDRDPTPALAAVSRRLGLGALWHRMFSELSADERQRVQFARALAQVHGAEEPTLLIDEPSAAPAPKLCHTVLRVARAEAAAGAAVLAVLHDLDLVRAYADHTVLMRAGRVVEDGPTRRVATRSGIAHCLGAEAAVAMAF